MNEISTRVVYGKKLVELGEKYKDMVVLDADLAKATKTSMFKEAYPERFFDMGIAEQDLMGTAAGLAASGKIPVVSTFALFATGRAFEQIRNSIAYPGLNVKIIATHGGVSIGADGGSHQAIEDISLMRTIPNMTILVPADGIATEWAVEKALEIEGPVYVRLGRHEIPIIYDNSESKFSVGSSNTLVEGTDVMLAVAGEMVYYALQAAEELKKEGISIQVTDFYSLKPIDEETIINSAKKVKGIITIEDHSTIGGLGSAVSKVVVENYPVKVKRIGVDGRFGQSGSMKELFKEYGLTIENIIQQVKTIL